MKSKYMHILRKESEMKYIVTNADCGSYTVMEYNSYLNRYFPMGGRVSRQQALEECRRLRDRYMLIRVAELRKEYGRYRRIPGAEKRVF